MSHGAAGCNILGGPRRSFVGQDGTRWESHGNPTESHATTSRLFSGSANTRQTPGRRRDSARRGGPQGPPLGDSRISEQGAGRRGAWGRGGGCARLRPEGVAPGGSPPEGAALRCPPVQCCGCLRIGPLSSRGRLWCFIRPIPGRNGRGASRRGGRAPAEGAPLVAASPKGPFGRDPRARSAVRARSHCRREASALVDPFLPAPGRGGGLRFVVALLVPFVAVPLLPRLRTAGAVPPDGAGHRAVSPDPRPPRGGYL
jgi:hypothetical protein